MAIQHIGSIAEEAKSIAKFSVIEMSKNFNLINFQTSHHVGAGKSMDDLIYRDKHHTL